MIRRLLLSSMVFLPVLGSAEAYQPARNRIYVKSSTWGACYVKAIPHGKFNYKGVTRLYAVGKKRDRLLATFRWYSPRVFLQCNLVNKKGKFGAAIVRIFRGSGGRGRNAKRPAIAFYFRNKLLRKYTYAELHGDKTGARYRYAEIAKIPGFRWIKSNDHAFDVKTQDGKTFSFDPVTGKRRKSLAMSTGAPPAIWLADRYKGKGIAGMALLSANFSPGDKSAWIFTWPWGLQIVKLVLGVH